MDEIWPAQAHWTRPEGGMFLWGVLPEGMDSAEVLKQAIARKVAFVPGAAFHPNGGGNNTMRINFSYSKPDTIREGMTRLGYLLKELISRN
jgi:2-aminoadipate transaminase